MGEETDPQKEPQRGPQKYRQGQGVGWVGDVNSAWRHFCGGGYPGYFAGEWQHLAARRPLNEPGRLIDGLCREFAGLDLGSG